MKIWQTFCKDDRKRSQKSYCAQDAAPSSTKKLLNTYKVCMQQRRNGAPMPNPTWILRWDMTLEEGTKRVQSIKWIGHQHSGLQQMSPWTPGWKQQAGKGPTRKNGRHSMCQEDPLWPIERNLKKQQTKWLMCRATTRERTPWNALNEGDIKGGKKPKERL